MKWPAVYWGWKQATGLICFSWRHWNIHIGIRRKDWVWGYVQDWYDGPLHNYGLGPLFLIVADEYPDHELGNFLRLIRKLRLDGK